MPNVPTAFTLE